MAPDTREDVSLSIGIQRHRLADINRLTVDLLEAGYETPARPAILLLHGFPGLAFS